MTQTHRDKLLHELYQNKNFIVFWRGQDYFDQQVQDVLKKYTGEQWGNNWVVDQAIWEMENLCLEDSQ